VHIGYTDLEQTHMISICRDRRIMESYNAEHTTHNGTHNTQWNAKHSKMRAKFIY